MSVIRTYKQLTGQVLQALMFFRGIYGGVSGSAINEEAAAKLRTGASGRYSDEVIKAIDRLQNVLGVEVKDLDDLIEILAKQVNSEDKDKDLIDTIVRILQLPYGVNVFNSSVLKLLRDAILIPQEVAAFKARAGKAELSCSECGKTLRDGEMVTFGIRYSNVSFLCTTCRVPTLITCNLRLESNRDGCGISEIPKKIRSWLERGMPCPECTVMSRVQEAAARVPVVAGVGMVEAERGPQPGDPIEMPRLIAASIQTLRDRLDEVRQSGVGVLGNDPWAAIRDRAGAYTPRDNNRVLVAPTPLAFTAGRNEAVVAQQAYPHNLERYRLNEGPFRQLYNEGVAEVVERHLDDGDEG